jgi:hypothetical protein
MKNKFYSAILLFFMTITALQAQVTSGKFVSEGNKFYAAKDYASAIASYLEAIQADPNNAVAYQGLGNCHYMLNMKEDALDAYQKSLALNPDNPSLVATVKRLQMEVVPVPTIQPTADGTSPEVPAVPPLPKQKQDRGLYLRLGFGGDLGSDLYTNPGVGQFDLGYRFNHTWAIQAEWSNLWSNVYEVNFNQNRFLGELKVSAGPGPYQVYGLVGGGIDMVEVPYDSPSFIPTNYLDFLFGLGFQARLGNVFVLFTEVRCNFTLQNFSYGYGGSITTDFPLTTGIGFDF